MNACDARLDLLLEAICALAIELPPEARQSAAARLAARVDRMTPLDEVTDAAIASDLARILDTLGRLPATAVTPRSH